MATRSIIAIKTGDTFKSVYCHWDGYVENNGVLLNSYYNKESLAEALVDGGDMSSLAETNDTCERVHTNGPALEHYNLKEVLNTANNCFGEYVYVWMEGRWTVIAMDEEKGYILADLVDTKTS